MKKKKIIILFYIGILGIVLLLISLNVNNHRYILNNNTKQSFFHYFDIYEFYLTQVINGDISSDIFHDFLLAKDNTFYDLTILDPNKNIYIQTQQLINYKTQKQITESIINNLDIPLDYYAINSVIDKRHFQTFTKKVEINKQRWTLNITTDQTTFFASWKEYRIIWFSIYFIFITIIFVTIYLMYQHYSKKTENLIKKKDEYLFLDDLIKNDNQSLSVVINNELQIENISSRLANILKYDQNALIGKKITWLINNMDMARLLQFLSLREEVRNDEVIILDKTGNNHTFIFTLIPAFNERNALLKAMIIFYEISNLKLELKELEYEVKKNSVLNTISQLVINIDDSKTIIEIIFEEGKKLIDYDYATMFVLEDDFLCPYFSTDPKILGHENEVKIPLGESLSGLVASIKKSMMVNDTKNNPIVFQLDDQDDAIDECLLSSPILDNKNNLLGVISLIRESKLFFKDEDLNTLELLAVYAGSVFDKINLLKNIVESENKYKTLINESALAIIIILDKKIIFCNDRFCEYLSFKEKELLGKEIVDLISERDRSLFISHLTNCNMEDTTEVLEFEFKSSLNKTVILELSLSTITWENNKCILATANNVTEKTELSKKLIQAQKIETIGALTSGIVHDFKNVLSGILGAVDLMLVRLDKASNVYNLAKIIKTSANRAVILSQRLLSYSRKDDDEEHNFDLNEYLREMIEIISYTFDKNIEVKLDLTDESLYFRGEPTKIQQCVQNICVNARDAMPEGGTLSVKTKLLKDIKEVRIIWPAAENRMYSLIEISDTGSGIPANIQDSIFDAFITTKEKGKGTGLGLSTTKSIINVYKGDISFISKVGEGTTFYILLPWAQKEVNTIQTKIESTETKTHTILLVDDEEIVLEIGTVLLEELGNKVYSTNNGISALEILNNNPEITLAIIDRIMPKMDGLLLLKKIKALNPEVTVIIASGLLQEKMVQDFKDNGALDCITKPYRLETLRKLLNDVK